MRKFKNREGEELSSSGTSHPREGTTPFVTYHNQNQDLFQMRKFKNREGEEL